MNLNSSTSPRVRSVTSGDVRALKHVLDETGLFPSSMLDGLIAPYLSDPDHPHLWLAAECDGSVIAFGYCEPERMTVGTWNLLAIGVLPSHQGHGVGSAIVGHLERHLAGRSERILLVETIGTSDFATARAFYRARGFVEEARIRDFYDADADKLVFWKRLLHV